MNINFYQQHAEVLAQQYDGVSADTVHRIWRDKLPKKAGKALDVGAGSGRDARWLASKGWQVTAVEPSSALRKIAQQHHISNIEWLDDSLPELTSLVTVQHYDLILVSAVWMHLTHHQQITALKRLRELASCTGVIVITWRNQAREQDRIFYDVDTTIFGHNAIMASDDKTGRDEVIWQCVVVEGGIVEQGF